MNATKVIDLRDYSVGWERQDVKMAFSYVSQATDRGWSTLDAAKVQQGKTPPLLVLYSMMRATVVIGLQPAEKVILVK